MSNYPEVLALNELILNHKIKIKVTNPSSFAPDWLQIILIIGPHTYVLHIDDEYSDFRYQNPALNLCVVLRNLEELADATNYNSWARATGIDSQSEENLNYFKSALLHLEAIENLIGPIDSKISDLDFSLNAGSAQYLRANG